MSSKGEYLNATVFIDVGAPDHDGNRQRQPRNAGYAKRVGDKLYVQLQLVPTPGQGWDGSIVIEKKQEQDEQQGQQRQQSKPQNRRRS